MDAKQTILSISEIFHFSYADTIGILLIDCEKSNDNTLVSSKQYFFKYPPREGTSNIISFFCIGSLLKRE